MADYDDGIGDYGAPPKDARTWAMICHLSALVGYILIPLGNLVVPAVIWMMKKDTHPFVDEQGKEALNFQISMTIYACIAAFLIIIVVGIIILPIIALTGLILTIVAGIKANDGVSYRYPFTIRLLD